MFAKSTLRALLLLLLCACTGFRHPDHASLPNLDKRVREPLPPARQAAAKALRDSAALKLELHPVTHSAAHVTARNGFLTWPGGAGKVISEDARRGFAKDDPHATAKAFLSEYRTVFGHGAEALEGATVQREFITAHNGLRTVTWQQHVDAIPVFESVLTTHTTGRGELVSISSQFVSDRSRDALLAKADRAPTLIASDALGRAAENLGHAIKSSDISAVGEKSGAMQQQRFTAAGFVGEITAELVWLPMSANELRLCWNVVLKARSHGETFRILVDAASGEILLRRCLTVYATNSTYRVFTSDSPSPFSPGHATPLTNQPALTTRSLVTLSAWNTNASPESWIPAHLNETRGNNVNAHRDTNDDDLPDLPRPQGSPHHVFDFPLDLTQSPAFNGNAAVVQLFYWCNWLHDRLYELGFTEAAGNFQVNNFGRGGAGNDPVQADAQDGASFNNASMSVLPDGISPRMQMYLWNGPSPDIDGSFDAEIVIHEYVHGLSSRRVGGGVGLFEEQSAGMGEGWSDFYALALLSEPADDVNAAYAMGAYSTFQYAGVMQNYYFGIRRYPYSTDLTKNPLTFKDIDPAQASTHSGVPTSSAFGGGGAEEVHNQGEVWCVALWEARANLIAKHGWTNGNELMLQLVTDGMNLSPANPNFLQARDAIIQADLINNNGENYLELWAAFAKRGMGASATSPASSTTSGVVEAFDLPDGMSILPNEGSIASGPVGGLFNITNQLFSLQNNGSNAFTWTAFPNANWL